ncbi:unnamed protein product [Auanema sp. JU1783]|nr:unnamed protein product [Auanema sp. JU1783]
MNSVQLQDFLTNLSTNYSGEQKNDEVDLTTVRRLVVKTQNSSHMCMNYIICNYTDIDLVQPILAQLLALYYKGGILRQYAIQYIPAFIGSYMLAASKKQQRSVSMFETFFLAIYNEEILETKGNSPMATKKVEEIRIPSIRFPSIYHDPMKITSLPEIATLRPGGVPSVLTTVRVGPYPNYVNFSSENKFLILTKLMKTVNNSVCYIYSEVLSRFICLTALSISMSGFSFPETPLRLKVLNPHHQVEAIEDYSKKARQQVNSSILLELLTGVYLSLYNGTPDLALRAIDAVHQRAQYEMLPDVLIVTNAIRNALLESPVAKEKIDELAWKSHNKEIKRTDLVTNASLRMRRMPEDIPIQPELKEKEHSRIGELVEEGMDHFHDLKKRVSSMSLNPKTLRRRKSDAVDVELLPISEEKLQDKNNAVSASQPDQQQEKTESKSMENSTDNGVVGDQTLKHSDDEYASDDDVRPRGTFTVNGLRHMDSGGSTQRSIDHS